MIISSAYLVSGALAAFASLNSKSRTGVVWWMILGLGLCMLGILRFAEAGVWTDDYLRTGLFEMGWYDYRRPIQVVSVAAFALSLLPAVTLLPSKRVPLILGILAFYGLAVFAAVRFSSLHWSDAILGEQIGSVMLSHAIQIFLLTVTASAALLESYAQFKKRDRDVG